MQQAMLHEMGEIVSVYEKKKQIEPEHAKNAREAIKFYSEHVIVLPFQKHPSQVLAEIAAIDFSQEVEIKTVKAGRIMTQMQPPDSLGNVGSFYTDGILPSDFAGRASDSGIGLSVTQENQKAAKSVYQSKTTKTSVFLQSTAAPAEDI
jgi:hypothetical protein